MIKVFAKSKERKCLIEMSSKESSRMRNEGKRNLAQLINHDMVEISQQVLAFGMAQHASIFMESYMANKVYIV
jgi:hypothetical protein